MIRIEIEILVNNFVLKLSVNREESVFFDIPLNHKTLILQNSDPKEETKDYYAALIAEKINSINGDIGNGYSIDSYQLQKEFKKVEERIDYLFSTPFVFEQEIKKGVKVSTFLKSVKELGLPKYGKKLKGKISLSYGRN